MLTIRSQDSLPQDPLVHLRDYYGQERSPMWDVVDQLKEDNERLAGELPAKHALIDELTAQLKHVRLQNRAMLVFANLMDTDKTGSIGYKSIIVKISGFAKFDLDTKINKENFYALVEGMCRRPV